MTQPVILQATTKILLDADEGVIATLKLHEPINIISMYHLLIANFEYVFTA